MAPVGEDGTANPGKCLHDRAAKIRMPLQLVAERAGINKHTVYGLPHRKGAQRRSFDAVERVILVEELRLRDHLLKLHPLERVECSPPSAPGDAAATAP